MASMAAWATWGCTSATSRFAPVGFRGLFARCCRTSCRASRRAGGVAPCETWDNATLLCDVRDPSSGGVFPLTLKTQRIAPGEKDTWCLEVLGVKASARFSTKNPKRLDVLDYSGGEQIWGRIDMGQETAFKSITGGIFESRLLGCDSPDVGRLPV